MRGQVSLTKHAHLNGALRAIEVEIAADCKRNADRQDRKTNLDSQLDLQSEQRERASKESTV